MPEVQIRRYVGGDDTDVKEVFTLGMKGLIPYSSLHVLRQTQTQMLMACVFCALLASSKSFLLPVLAVTVLLATGRLGIIYIVDSYIHSTMQTDFKNIHQTYLEQPSSCFWVAESQGRVVGTVACLPAERDKDCLELKRLSVKHSHRGQGIAKALCRTVADLAREQGYPAVVLYTSNVQIDAQRLYERLGYKKVKEFAVPEMFPWITKFMMIKYVLDLQQPGQ